MNLPGSLFQKARALAILTMFISLTACGGGTGDEASTTNSTDTSTASTVPEATSGTTTNTGTSGSGGTTSGGSTGTTTSGTAVSISSTQPAGYVWNDLTIGEKTFTDRDITYTSIPASYLNYKVLQTANDDKASSGGSFVTFDVSTDTTIYVGHDQRVSTKPSWLSGWTDTGETVSTNDTDYSIFKKDFASSRINIGGNEGGSGSMYFVFLNADSASGSGSTGSGSTGSGSTGSGSTGSGSTGSGSTGSGSTGSGSTGSGSTGSGTTTGSATIRWTPPTTNEDGSALQDLAGYKIHYGTSQGSYPNVVVVGNNITEHTLSSLSSGTYYFVITAHDQFGNDSAFSDPPVSKAIN